MDAEAGYFVTGSRFWQNRTEAFRILNPLVALNTPSKEALVQLSTTPPLNGSSTNPVDSQVAFVFLKAVAKHIPVATTDAIVASVDHIGVAQLLDALSERVGKAATFCEPRSRISDSGILWAFCNVYDRSISVVSVEFFQCALLAGQYRLVARAIGEDWPLPGKGTSVELVLRYFYLRGLVHLGCDDLKMAVRCFWTVLSIPSDAVSLIAVDAWKKMILTKCILMRDSIPYNELVAAPAGVSYAAARLFAAQSSSPSTTDQSSAHISAYLELAKAAHAGAAHEFDTVSRVCSQIWEDDGNSGMVLRLANDVQHRQIIELASVFKMLPLSKMATELGTSEQTALDALNQTEGLKYTTIDGMIMFKRSSFFQVTTGDANSLTKLAESVRKLDVSTTMSSRYQAMKGESGRAPRGVDDF